MWPEYGGGRALAETAKHAPDQLDPDVVRQAGRRLEVLERMLSRLESLVRVDDESWDITFRVDKDTRDEVLGQFSEL